MHPGRHPPTGLGDPAQALALGLPGVDVLGPAVASIALVAVLFGVAALAFRRQELRALPLSLEITSVTLA